MGVSPYSTGGGGTVLEHRYGAVILSHLLAGTPVPALGDHITPQWVRFQARDASPVDDILVCGAAPNDARCYLSIGVRRKPKLTVGEEDSVKLITTYVSVVVHRWPMLQSGRWRLALAVVPSCTPALQLKPLATLAAAAGNEGDFRHGVEREGNPRVRHRLRQVDDLVRAALDAGIGSGGILAAELTWRLLSKLSLVELRLEEADLSDRTAAVERLQKTVTPGRTPAEADQLFTKLCDLVGTYAPSGARVTLSRLQADLHGFSFFHDRPPLPPSGSTTPRTSPGHVRVQRSPSKRGIVELWSQRAVSPDAGQPWVCEDTVVVTDRYLMYAFEASTGEPLWREGSAYASPPILGDGAVFLPDRKRFVLTRSLRTGRIKRPELRVRMREGLALFDRGTLYAPDPDGRFQAIDTFSRTVLWTVTLGLAVMAPHVQAATVYLVTTSTDRQLAGQIHAVDTESGKALWPKAPVMPQIRHWSFGSHALYVIHGSEGSAQLTALSIADGTPLWRFDLAAPATAAPKESGDTLVIADRCGTVYGLGVADGVPRWQRTTGQKITTAPVLWNDRAFIGTWDRNLLMCLEARTGEVEWRARAAGAFATQPFIVGDAIYAAHRAGALLGWDAMSGKKTHQVDDLLWEPDTQGTPAIHGQILYVTTRRGLRALALP